MRPFLILLCVALLALSASCKRAAPIPSADASERSDQASKLDGPAVQALPEGVQRGVCLAHNWQHGGDKGYGTQDSLESKQELVKLGVDWVSLTPFGWQKSLESREVGRNTGSHQAGETDERMIREIAQARQLGLKVMLKPHLWVNHSDWRGHIKPAGADGWEAWFKSYGEFILHYARMAQEHKVEALVIGLELASSSWGQPQRWEALIQEIRAVYQGKIIYAANWNEAEGVTFWDKVDWIGIQFFPPLTESLEPSYDELAKSIDAQLDVYEKLSRKYQRPVVLTEYGYKSIKAAAISPHTWPEHLPEEARSYDEGVQALAFKALFNRVGRRDFIQGIYLWKWFTDVNTDEEGRIGFSPRGKKAASVMKAAHQKP